MEAVNKDDNESTSAQNGDKARYGRLRKKKIARRVRMRDLQKSLLKTSATSGLTR
jgi:hypothetical protein